jgi:perosamine synthetase
MNIPMARPFVGERELERVREVFQSGWLGEGHVTAEFERAISSFTGSEYVVAVNTGTSALHLALHALGVGPGAEVVLPSMTFASDPQAVAMCGANPVFCDIDLHTLNADPKSIKDKITSRTRAIMPTDFAGLPCDVGAIRRVIGNSDIRIIRDASHSFGSRLDGKVLGAHNDEDATCFSFDPIKNLTCGEGGAILVKSKGIADALRSQKVLGIDRDSGPVGLGQKKVHGHVIQRGFRYHMSNINAAIGLAQLEQFSGFCARRQELAMRYDQLLKDHQHICLFDRDYEAIVPFMYVIRVDAKFRDLLAQFLADKGVHADLRYFPAHLQGFWQQTHIKLPVTEMVAAEMLSLPMYHGMTISQVEFVVDMIETFFSAARTNA